MSEIQDASAGERRGRRRSLKLVIAFAALALFTGAPVWSVQYFINQDGSGHINGAWVMTELLRGDPLFTEHFRFNFIFYPNSSGHWLLAAMLQVVSAFTATKAMMSLTYLGLVAAVVWLRRSTAGNCGLFSSMLIGGALAYNWLWLEGFYNFNIGFIAAIFAIGSYYRWREEMNANRAAGLALFLFFVFFSHIVSFAILAGSIAVLCVLPAAVRNKRNIAWTAAAFIPVVPVAVLYKLSTGTSSGFTPVWRNLNDLHSAADWLTQFRGVDSFMIISRRTFPFVDAESPLFAVFTPLVWIVIALIVLMAATRLSGKGIGDVAGGRKLPFALLSAGSIIVSILSPDNFEFTSSTGGVLRERIFLCGLIFMVPLFNTAGASAVYRRAAHAALMLVIAFQTAALWEYALTSDRDAREYLSAGAHVPDGGSLAAVTLVPRGMRFSSSHIGSMDNYIGIGRNILVWDNYEFGHYLFPVVARESATQEFALEYTGSNSFEMNNPERNSEERYRKLAAVFAANNARIDTLLVWGSDPRIEAAFAPWFEPEPYFSNGRVRLFRHRQQ